MISINELADEYENQYKLLCTKIEGLRPLLCVYILFSFLRRCGKLIH